MKTKLWMCVVVIGAALVLMSMPSVVRAEELSNLPGSGAMGGKDGMKGMKKHMQQMDEKLGLTDEQRAKMKALREENRAATENIRAQLKARHDALKQELDGQKPDRAKAEVLVKEISGLEEQMGMARVDQVLKTRAVLTPEQYKKLCEFREKNKREFKGRHKEKRRDGAHQGSEK